MFKSDDVIDLFYVDLERYHTPSTLSFKFFNFAIDLKASEYKFICFYVVVALYICVNLFISYLLGNKGMHTMNGNIRICKYCKKSIETKHFLRHQRRCKKTHERRYKKKEMSTLQ